MIELMASSLLKIAILLVFLLVKGIVGIKGKLDTLIFAFLVMRLIGELVTFFVKDGNILYYSLFTIFDNAILVFITYSEVKRKSILIFGFVPFLLLFVFFMTTDQSFITMLGYEDSYELLRPFGVHQFFDLCSWMNLMMVVFSFIWLSKTIDREELVGKELTKRFIYIFSFLAFYGGSFFTLAFARLALPGTDHWREMWYTIYIPLYFLFILALLVGLLWKPIRL